MSDPAAASGVAPSLTEARIAAYVRGELDECERAAIEIAIDREPQWLAVVALMARMDDDAIAATRSRAPSGLDTVAAGDTAARLDLEQEARLPRGTRVGRYEIEAPIGRGGMGTVWAALDPRLGRRVAIKLLHTGTRDQARMTREARALARVADPRVLAILDVGSWRGRVFVTTELLDGETLQTWRARTRPAWTEVVARYLEAGRGLAAAHAAGVIHRDFKPANVMQTRDGRVVVLDFGLAQLDDEHGSGPSDGGDDGEPSTITARVVGTPAFMAPEQRDGRACGPEADQFAFCVALWAALFGRFPAAATYPAANVGHGPARGRVPLALRRALERGLAGAPDDRHRTMAALLQAIERARRSVRRRRLLAALALPVLALAAMRPGTDDQRCSGAAQALARSYDPARARAAAEAIAGSGHAWSEDAAAGVRRALDGYAASWLVAHEQACEAAAARAFAGDPLLDAQMACLDRRRLALATVLDGLVEGGHDPSRTALAAVEGLPPVASCNGDDALAEAARLPDDPVARRAAATLREQADRIGALRRLARFDDALALAQSARDDAARLGDLATQAEVGLAAAGLFDDLGRWSDVEDALTTALQAAESAGYDSAAATAAMRLGDLLGERLGRVDEARALLDQAQRWMERAGEPSGLAVELARTRGYVELAAGAPAQARARFEQALVAAAGSSGAVDPDELALVHNGLGNATLALGELDAAHHALELALASLRARLGPHHPNVVRAQVNLASVRRMRGDASGARALLLDSLATVQDAGTRAQPVVSETLLNLAVAELDLGFVPAALQHLQDAETSLVIEGRARDPMLAKLLALRGDALVGAGRARDAIAELERARELLTALSDAPGAELGIVESNLGAAFSALGDPDRAAAHQRRALALLEAASGTEHPDLAFPLLALAQAHGARGRHDEALPLLRRAAAIAPPQARPFALARLAAGLVALGRVDEGIDSFARALAGFDEVDIDPALVGDVEESFATALWSAARPTEARAAAVRARDAYVDADQGERADAVQAWLDAHPDPSPLTRSPPARSQTPRRR